MLLFTTVALAAENCLWEATDWQGPRLTFVTMATDFDDNPIEVRSFEAWGTGHATLWIGEGGELSVRLRRDGVTLEGRMAAGQRLVGVPVREELADGVVVDIDDGMVLREDGDGWRGTPRMPVDYASASVPSRFAGCNGWVPVGRSTVPEGVEHALRSGVYELRDTPGGRVLGQWACDPRCGPFHVIDRTDAATRVAWRGAGADVRGWVDTTRLDEYAGPGVCGVVGGAVHGPWRTCAVDLVLSARTSAGLVVAAGSLAAGSRVAHIAPFGSHDEVAIDGLDWAEGSWLVRREDFGACVADQN